MGKILNSIFGKDNKENLKKILDINDDKVLNMKEEDINNLCLKIHIVGSGDKMQYIINNMFKEEVSDENLKTKFKVTKQFKTDQFHWIAHVYESGLLNEDLCKEIEKEIKEDRQDKGNEKIILKNQVILCFGNENTELLSSYFKKFRKSNMIFITETECKISEKMDKRYGTNIIYKELDDKEMNNKELNVNIMSLLWELDCYFKEKGNLYCRYSPENIFNGLENDNSLFTLNILVAGLARVGKSTFINLISRKLSALESDLAVSVTKNISDYYIYKNDNKQGHAAIKLIDTPGLVKNKTDKDYKEKENKIKELIKNEEKNIDKRIHFIFFILLKDSKIQINDSNNVKEIFKELNNSKVPVFFIINKVKKTAKFNEIITPMKESLNQNGFDNLSKDENFIPANFIKGDMGEIHGIDTIFSKILNHINNKKYLDNKLQLKMQNLLKDFRATVESDMSFLSLKKDDDLTIKELKDKIKFNEEMDMLNDIIKDNYYFSNINIDSLIKNGEERANKCLKVILSLSNLKDILPNISQNLPAISIYQAFMVKEIGAGFGLDIDILNSGTNKLVKFIGKYLPLIEKNELNTKKDDFNKVDVIELKNIIEKKAENILNISKNNRDTVFSLADLLNRIKKINGNNEDNDANENVAFSLSVYKYCIYFFEKEIKESRGLCFLSNYYNKFQSLMEDINYYREKKDWESYEMQILKI